MLLEEIIKTSNLFPNDFAIITENKKTTFSELIILAKKIANKLKKYNVCEKDYITIELDRSEAYVASMLGAWMVNSCFAALDISYPSDRLDYIAQDCNAKVRINDEFISDINNYDEIDNIIYPASSDHSLLVYTSGSTGKPKGVLHTHLSMYATVLRGELAFNSNDYNWNGKIFGQPIPFSFIAGLALLGGNLVGAVTTYIIPYVALKDPKIMSKVVYDNNISIAYIPPKMLKVFENKGNVLKIAITGSEKVSNVYREDLEIINGYGSSETAGGVLFFKIDKEYDNTPIGKPTNNEKVYLLDENGKECDEGELCLSGYFASGYLNLDEQTKAQFIKNPFKDRDGFDILYKTGDIARRLKDGNYLYINRNDWMIKINGQRVEPGEIEGVIKNVCGINDCAVKDFSGNAGQTYIVAYYTTSTDIGEELIKNEIKNKLPQYMMPSYFVKLDKLPINQNGKLDRKALMAPIIKTTEFVAPKTKLEKELCNAFEKALNIENVGIKDDFFYLGGDSIRVMVLEQLCPNLKISTKMIYECRTVEKIAEALKNQKEEKNEKIDIYNDIFPLNQAQLGIFLSCEAREGEIAYNNPILISFNKNIDEIKLQKAIEDAIYNHKGLFATILIDDSGMPNMRYNKEFEKDICNITYLSENEFNLAKNDLIKPFYIKKDRLFRFNIFKTNNYIYLFMDIHHIMFDGFSFQLLLPEIINNYNGIKAKKEEITAYHAALYDQKLRNSDEYNSAKDYYLKEFGEVEEINLPIGDVKENEIKFMEYKTSLDIDLNKIKEFCIDNKITENSFTTAAFGYLLSLYTMNKKVAFATVYNGRSDIKYANTVSMFVKTLPILCNIDSKLSIIDYINNIKNQMLESMANDIYSFRELASVSGYTSDILFTYQGDLFQLPKYGEMDAKFVELPFNATGEKLSIQIYPLNNKLILDIQYHGNIYSEKWINDFAKRYQLILNSFLDKLYLADCMLVDEDEIKNIINVSYGGDLKYDENITFIDMFINNAKLYPNNLAVVDKISKYTYKELDEISNIIANYLVKNNVGENEFVAIKIGRIKEFYAAIVGIQKSGAAYVPIDPTYPSDRIEYMVEDSNAKIVLTKELIDEIIKDNNKNYINKAKANNAAYMIYTSGSTGKPKGVVIPHSALSCLLAWNKEEYKLDQNSVCAEHASFSFDASVLDIFPPLAAGACVHILSEEVRMDLDLTYKYFIENKVKSVCMSTQIGMSLINAHPDLPLRFMNIGGEKFLQVEKTNIKIYNGYGPTEFTVCSSFEVVNQDSDKDIPIGKAVKNTYSFICDYNGNLLPLGMSGEICLAGPQLSYGYYNRDELNKERFIEAKFLNGQKMYKTGDLAKYNNEGKLEYIGRIDFQVKLRGFRIELGEIENCASTYEGVKQTIALVKNKQLVLYFTADNKINIDDLKKHMQESLTEYMVPNIFMQLDNMPLTPGGKIDRKALPDIEKNIAEIVKPRDENEQKIFDLLSKILGFNDFGVLDDFSYVGLTSLSAMQFSSLLSKELNKAIRVSDLVKYNTIESLSKFILNKEEEAKYAILDEYPLTMVQHGILTEVLAHPNTTIYNVPSLIELPIELDINKMASAIKAVIDIHPYLKGRIISNANGDFCIKRNDILNIDINIIDINDLKNGPQDLVKPFDLLNDQLVRVYLIKCPDKTLFFFDAHHIIFDGESLDILLKDINNAYMNKDISMESYTEYELALDEEKLRKTTLYNEAKEYYNNLVDGIDIDCLLVNDINEKEIGKKSISLNVNIDKNKLNKYINDNKATINGLWISALGYTLAKFLNRKDAIFTTVYNGRSDTRLYNSVGMFVHTLPVVCKLDGFSAANEYVASIKDQIQKNMAYDIYGFAEIAHDFGIRADIMFVYEGMIAQGYQIDGHKISNANLLAVDELKATILIAISDIEDGFNIHVEYDGNKYESWSLNSFIKAMVITFNSLIDNVNLDDINLIDNNDLKLIDKYNDTKVDIIKDDIVSEFRNIKDKYPNNIAVIYKDLKLTYKEVDEITDRIAYNLANKNIGRGSVVSVLTKRNQNMVLTTLGILKTGAAYQPLDCTYPSDRLLFMIKDANAKLIIAEEDLLDKIPGNTVDVLFTKEFDKLDNKKVTLTNPNSNDLFILLYTSGTTGIPKGVMLNHLNLVNFSNWYRKYYNLTPNDVVSAYAGFGFDACMMDLYPALTTGAAVCIVPDELRMNLDQLKLYFDENKVSHSFMTTQVGRLFASENDDCSLKYLSVGGEKLTPLAPPNGYKLINGYGPTECTIFTTVQEVDKLYHRIPIGRPLDNYKLYVVDDKFKQLPNGALGELLISGYGVGIGYLNQEEKTKQTFINNIFDNEEGHEKLYRTGDLVRRLADGSIDFIGRNDGQVKIRGFRIELSEVEMAIRSFEGIKDVTVQAFDLEAGGKFLAAYFTSDKEIDIEKIKEHIKANKPSYMVPASIMQLDAIPLNQNQKVNKRALPKPTFKTEKVEYVAPKNKIEEDFCLAFSQILGIDKVSATDSFFEIGGTSLTAAKVVIFALNKGYQISYQDIFANPTAVALALFISNNNQANNQKEEIIIDADDVRPSLKYNDIAYVDDIKIERSLGKVLLAGATGFLGIHILKELIDQKINTIVLTRAKEISPTERIKELLMYYFDSPFDEEVDKYITVIDDDITNDKLANSLNNLSFDTIINSAAIVKHFASDDSIEKVNFGGVKNLIKIAKEHNARLIQVSTLSVAGENIDHKFDSNYLMKENQLYFGQDLSNKYVNSKFKAESAILDEIENNNLDAKIIRVGNLMSRQRDGEFQINSVTNAFMRSLKSYTVLGKFPISRLDSEVDFTPIDEVAKTIILFAQTPSKFSVFHSLNSHRVQMGDVIDAMNLAGIKIDKVNDKEFAQSINIAMQDEKKSMEVSSLLSYATSDNLSHEFIQSDSTYTVKALYRLGYRWPITDFEYLIKTIKSLKSLGFFE